MKRELTIYEIVNKAGTVIGYAPTTTLALRQARQANSTYRTTNVPMRPTELCDYLTLMAAR